ncbi:MAG: DUF2497 domain-containing protein [Alphaproteobacteria bacterium]|nr:DUF2497 domain-containing protein [Alphaproteobacteria bacterium]
MKTEKPISEPSMDEILASIRQIIGGDSHEEKSNPLPSKDSDDILDLTHILPEESQKKESYRFQGEASSPSSFPLPQKNDAAPFYQTTPEKQQNEIPPISPSPSLSRQGFEEAFISPTVLSETVQAFSSLDTFARENLKSSALQRHEGSGGETIENMVRQILKPLLKEWLDTHLPTLVRRVVTEQVEKIVQQATTKPAEKLSEVLRSSGWPKD